MESPVRPPPYPPDTRAKGWRFELDYEQIEQSDTWPLAAEVPMAQHALLMMWLVAWKQVPCGSFPNDEDVIRAKCRIPLSMWSKCRNVLMRGWWVASDGLMYHDTLTKRVVEMMKRRRSDSDRQAAKRLRDAAESPPESDGVTGESRVTPAGLRPESSTDNRQPNTSTDSGDSSGVPKTKTRARKRAAPAELVSVDALVAEGVDKQHAEDWLRIRAHKNVPLTRTAWGTVKEEAAKACMTAPDAVKTCASEGWAGFKVKWLEEAAAERARKASKGPVGEQERRSHHEQAAATAKVLLFGAQQPQEVINA